jgi:6-phosphogluconolactonase
MARGLQPLPPMPTSITARAPRNNARLEIFADQAALAHAAAEELTATALAAVEQSGRFTIALSGGPAPEPVFELLADKQETFRDRFPWQQTHFFWGDERHVPPQDRQSNYRLAHDKMLSQVPVPEENVHRIRAEIPDADEAADLYEAKLRAFFQALDNGFPVFDLMWQGLGANGHTASLFPGCSALAERRRAVVATWIEKLQAHRITMTLPVLNCARKVLFVVSGTEPADALNQVLFGPQLSVPLPAQLVAPHRGSLLWLVDSQAGSRLAR